MRKTFSILGTVCFIVLSIHHPAVAGGPLVTVNGAAVRYSNADPIVYKTDLGAMGSFSNTVATNLAVTSFQVWQNVTTADISFTNGGALPVDVNASNYLTYLNKSNDGINPIIFDADGSIINALYGANSGVIGFAGSSYSLVTGMYTEGQAVMNGFYAGGDKFTEEQYKATFVHEFGHFIGLDHSQINSQFVGDGIAENDANIPTMYPTSSDDDTYLNTLNPDDIAAVSNLYPKAAFAASTGKISGSVVRSDNSIVRGANVIAMSSGVDSSFNQISTVTDYYKANNGNYTIIGLAPGAYFVKIEPILLGFTAGSSVGPYSNSASDMSFINPILKEFYNGAAESSDPITDLPSSKTPVTVSAGITTSGINFIGNKEPNAPITNILEYNGEPTYVVSLPSKTDRKRYSVRFTPGANSTFLRTEIMLNGGTKAILGTGSLKVSLHQNDFGSVGGVPGNQIGNSTSIPFSQLVKSAYNTATFSSQNLQLLANVNYHVMFEVVGGVGDTIQIVMDDGSAETNRSSSFYSQAWHNFIEPNNFAKGYNLIVRTVIDIPTDVSRNFASLPEVFLLEQNYPNPFNPTTAIRYQIPSANHVSLKIFDAIGREVAELVNETKVQGSYEVVFSGSHLSSGIYFARLQSGSQLQIKKLLLLK